MSAVQIADIVAARSAEGKNYGIVLIPEGLIEHIPQVWSMQTTMYDSLQNSKNCTDAFMSLPCFTNHSSVQLCHACSIYMTKPNTTA